MKRIKFLKIIIVLFNLIVLIRLFFIGVIDRNYYLDLYNDLNNKIIYSRNAPRGRILDRKGNILVDNKGVREIIYTKLNGISTNDEIEIASSLSDVLDIDYSMVSDLDLKNYYYLLYKDDVDELVSSDIKEKYSNRLISLDEFMNIKLSLISDEMLGVIDKEEAYIYKLMNKGYRYQEKVIKSDISLEEFTLVNELNLIGIRCDIYYERVFNYDTVLNQIFGSIGAIQTEKLNYYLDKGYSLDDTVGISFLEEYYEEYLRGIKASYKVNKDNTLKLISDEIRGNDLILSIDIDLQLKIEDILKEEIKKAKKIFSSKYYNGSYIVISNPNDGSLISLVGMKYDDGEFNSDVIGMLTNSYTVGSVVKGASHAVLYKNGIIDENTKIKDSCVKLYSQKDKCSWTDLGTLNDINALAKSSNYFQFVNAIKVSGYKYKRNMKFNPTIEDFNRYRDMYYSFGLGALTGIDIKGEVSGIRGTNITGDLLLNLSIGQYDTYTPLQLNQYISTIGNGGKRYKLRLVDSIINSDGIKRVINQSSVINTIDLDEKYLNRIKSGLEGVIKYGTGASYISGKDAGGKTGTSETFFNGKSTTTKSFVAYLPSDKPEYAISIISPNIGYENSISNYLYPINSRVSRQISNILFEN